MMQLFLSHITPISLLIDPSTQTSLVSKMYFEPNLKSVLHRTHWWWHSFLNISSWQSTCWSTTCTTSSPSGRSSATTITYFPIVMALTFFFFTRESTTVPHYARLDSVTGFCVGARTNGVSPDFHCNKQCWSFWQTLVDSSAVSCHLSQQEFDQPSINRKRWRCNSESSKLKILMPGILLVSVCS